MNADEFLRHYDRVADAQEAVTRLRRFVLDLAVRGKLVPQDDTDDPASNLLASIAAERAHLGVGSAAVPVGVDEMPFPLPSGWSWSRIGEVCSKTGSGSTPRGGQAAYKHAGIPFLRSQNVYDDGLRLEDVAFIDADTHARMAGTQVRPKDLLLNITGGSIGRCCRVPDDFGEANVSQHVAILRLAVPAMSDYLHRLVLSPYFQRFVEAEQTGAGRGGLPKGRMDHIAVAVPPLAEQRRIVAKVDELTALCDRLEAARAEREAARDRLTAASLARLNTPDPETFAEDARFALDALPALAARPDQIKQLRQTILGLAVRGRLASQVATDAPAVQLLAAIEQRRSDLLRSNYPNAEEARAQIKKQSDQVVPSGLDALPPGWAWATLMQCSLLVVDCKNKTAPYASAGVRLVRTTNVRDGRLNSLEPKFVSAETYEVWSARCKPAAGDILITREAPMGEVCIIPEDETVCLGQRMMLIRLVEQTIEPAFMLYSLRDPNLMNRVQDKPIGATVQHLRVGGVETLLVPLPPLEEQRRIVARLDELMTLCNQLEANLAAGSGYRSGLMEALLREAKRPLSPLEEAA